MSVLDMAERRLAGAGMQILVQTTTSILAAKLLDEAEIETVSGSTANGELGVPSRDALRATVQTAAELHQAAAEMIGGDTRLHVNVCIHCDRAVARRWGEQTRIAGGAIVDLGQWAPGSDLDGIFMTESSDGDSRSYVPVNHQYLAGLRPG